MPLFEFTNHDLLTMRLRNTLERITRSDICDLGGDFPEVRQEAHAEFRDVLVQAGRLGYSAVEIYDDVISEQEARADFEAE